MANLGLFLRTAKAFSYKINRIGPLNVKLILIKSKKVINDQELTKSDPISCPKNQKGNN